MRGCDVVDWGRDGAALPPVGEVRRQATAGRRRRELASTVTIIDAPEGRRGATGGAARRGAQGWHGAPE